MQVFSFFVPECSPELIHLEFHARFQIPGFQILGLPGPEIQESRDRICSAFHHEGLEFPKKRILVNLAPASLRKGGTGHDLAIALKILSETIDHPWPAACLAWGELGLNGRIRPAGKIAHLIELLLTRGESQTPLQVLLGETDFGEFMRLQAWRTSRGLPHLENVNPHLIHRLGDFSALLRENGPPIEGLPQSYLKSNSKTPSEPALLPLAPLHERLVQIASIGRHHALLLGPKGVGKSASFDWFETMTSEPTPKLAWERALYQESRGESASFDPPIRKVHSQVRPSHLLGSFGSAGYRAGELSLAHGGILFADEFPEWPRDAKECLREPLQSERFSLTRVKGTLEARCDLQLIGSGNLCPCGGFPKILKGQGYPSPLPCRCREAEVKAYLQKISGPILDRIDLIAILPDPPKVQNPVAPEKIQIFKNKIEAGRAFAFERHGTWSGRLPPLTLEKMVSGRSSFEKILQSQRSLRSRHKILRVACSLQALEQAPQLREEHLIESLAYRFPELT